MSLGSYPSGAMVRIPLQVTEGHIPAEAALVKVEKIYKPDLSIVAGFPKSMKVLDIENSIYYFDYTPSNLGNYVVVMTFYVSGKKVFNNRAFLGSKSKYRFWVIWRNSR